MENKEVFARRNFYNDGDSGKVYLFALILPILLAIVSVMISNVIEGATGSESFTDGILYNTIMQVVSSIALVCIYLVYNKCNNIEYKAINLKFKMKWHTYLLVIGIGIVSLFGLQYFIGAVDNFLELLGYPLQVASPDLPESLTNPKSYGIFSLAVIVVALLPAICEEILFRGVVLNGLRTRFGDIASIFLSALMFALMHQNLQQLVYPFLLGSVMGWIVLRTGSIASSIIVHFCNNFLTILFTYLSNISSFSLSLPNVWWFYLVAIALLALTAGIIYLIDRFYFKHKSKEETQKTATKTSKYIYISLAVAGVMFLFITVFNFVS